MLLLLLRVLHGSVSLQGWLKWFLSEEVDDLLVGHRDHLSRLGPSYWLDCAMISYFLRSGWSAAQRVAFNAG